MDRPLFEESCSKQWFDLLILEESSTVLMWVFLWCGVCFCSNQWLDVVSERELLLWSYGCIILHYHAPVTVAQSSKGIIFRALLEVTQYLNNTTALWVVSLYELPTQMQLEGICHHSALPHVHFLLSCFCFAFRLVFLAGVFMSD